MTFDGSESGEIQFFCPGCGWERVHIVDGGLPRCTTCGDFIRYGARRRVHNG